MSGTVEDASAASKPKPTILVPPRGSMEFLFNPGSGPGFSPGPMTLVSSLFPEKSPFSFSQLLAGAMASPLAAKTGLLPDNDSGKGSESGVGQKWNKPMNLAVAQTQLENLSHLFMVPPGLSPTGLLNSPGFLSPLHSPFGMSHQQALAHVTAQAAMSQSFMKMQSEFQHDAAEASANQSLAAPTETLTQQTNPLPPESESSKIESSEVSESDKRTAYVASDKPVSDGYNWRKYGQKHVKASECPRSYYKCTHLNCPVKKKVERSSDGRISEITYKGQHNHDPPQPNKRGKDSCGPDKTVSSHVKPVLPSQGQTETDRSRLNEGIPVHSESENFRATAQESSEHHQVDSHKDDVEDNVIVVDEGEDGEPIPKRRSMEIGPSVPASSHQTGTGTDAKIVLQTRSEVDLLDDGYKWRKYGQKVVKGNPHPRSYYRCTYAGCNVRKHVERSSTDPKAVITTYEGKHNHEIPAGRYSSHGTATTGSHQVKTQKTVSKTPSQNKEIDYGNKDQIPMTLQLKEEQIAA